MPRELCRFGDMVCERLPPSITEIAQPPTVGSAAALSVREPVFLLGKNTGVGIFMSKKAGLFEKQRSYFNSNLFLCKDQNEVVSDFRGMTDTLLQGDVAFQKFDDSHITFAVIDSIIDIFLNCIFLLSQFL
jgi:hypothetical protein